MATIRREKITVQTDDPFLVFLVGMRVNKITAFRKAYFVASSFIGMQKQLEAHPEKGCLWVSLFFRPMACAATFISYWRLFDDLERFARGKQDIHLTAWQEFYKRVGM